MDRLCAHLIEKKRLSEEFETVVGMEATNEKRRLKQCHPAAIWNKPSSSIPAAHTFYAVPIWKFIVLTIVSSGLYPLYWFWFNWKLIRDQEHKDFSPILRALFSFLYFSDLARTVLNAAKAKQYPETYNPTLLAWVFFIGILGSLSNSWIGGIIGIVGFLMVIPIIRAMAYVNSHTEGSSIQTNFI